MVATSSDEQEPLITKLCASRMGKLLVQWTGRKELQDGWVCTAFSTTECSLDSSLNLCISCLITIDTWIHLLHTKKHVCNCQNEAIDTKCCFQVTGQY